MDVVEVGQFQVKIDAAIRQRFQAVSFGPVTFAGFMGFAFVEANDDIVGLVAAIDSKGVLEMVGDAEVRRTHKGFAGFFNRIHPRGNEAADFLPFVIVREENPFPIDKGQPEWVHVPCGGFIIRGGVKNLELLAMHDGGNERGKVFRIKFSVRQSNERKQPLPRRPD